MECAEIGVPSAARPFVNPTLYTLIVLLDRLAHRIFSSFALPRSITT
jgi:hypothetical protein